MPSVAEEPVFAIKGGTAINLFIRDLPRLSVDLDLVYLPIQDRQQTIRGIEAGLLNIRKRLEMRYPEFKVQPQVNSKTQSIIKLYVVHQKTQIVIEPNLIFRGTVYPSQKMDLAPAAETRFKVFVSEVPIASIQDVYAGKLCAALDRQHPRDLFDVKLLLEEGITTELKNAFLIYLASNSRPMAELLDPHWLDQRQAYQDEFIGMVPIEVSYEALIEARERLVTTLHQILTDRDKKFLFSVKQGDPQWDQIDLVDVDQLPAIQWKLINIRKMDKAKHKLALAKLEKVLT